MKRTLNANTIKLIAVIAMTFDHLAWTFYPGYQARAIPLVMHVIGRITCPVMCYFIAEGYHHTKNVSRYTRRLFLFALVSHFAYVFFSEDFGGALSFLPFADGGFLDQTSVMWSLAWGLVMLRIADSQRLKEPAKYALILGICLITFPADWSCIASLCILAFGTNRGKFKLQMLWMLFYVALYSLVYALFLDPIYGVMQMAVAFAIPILACYNGKRGKRSSASLPIQYAFYLYYPLHLFVLGWLRALI